MERRLSQRSVIFISTIAAGLLLGCTTVAPSDSPPAGAGGGDEPAAPKVSRVVFTTPPPTGESNETRMLGQIDVWQLRPMIDYMIAKDATTGKLVPGLATEWSLEPSGKAYRFKLREGVKFQKGHGEFAAADVEFSWKDLIQEDSTHGEAPYWRRVVSSMEIVSPREIVFNIVPDANIIHSLSEAEGVMEIISKAHFDKMGRTTMTTEPYAGTGAYQFKERKLGEYVRFERTPDKHWNTTPDFPEMEFRFQKEASTRLASLLTGEAHMATLPQDLLKEAESRGMKVIKGKVPGLRTFISFYGAYMNDPKDASKGYKYPDSPWLDRRVRKALNHAINRDELNKAFFGGKGELMMNHHHHPTRLGWNPDWEKRFKEEYGYDPGKAKALLAEAGYGPTTPLKFEAIVLRLPQYGGAEDVLESVVSYWRAVGVEAELVTIESAEVNRLSRLQGYCCHARVSGTSSAILIGQVYASTLCGTNPGASGIQEEASEKLVCEIFATLDPMKQEELWRKLGDVEFAQYNGAPLFWLPAEAVINPNFVADYVFPGDITGTWTHVQNIKAAK